MPILTQIQDVKANVTMSSGALHIGFSEDPSYTRSETVIIDLLHRSIGIIFCQGYHHIGDLPIDIPSKELKEMTMATLSGVGEMGRQITLHAPVKHTH